jgi:DNA repair photolyase
VNGYTTTRAWSSPPSSAASTVSTAISTPEVCLAYRNPASVISKSALVERDLDLFVELARTARFSIAVSLAFSDAAMARALEPWAPSPARRLQVIETLAAAGLDVAVMVAPVIPGLNDRQLVEVLERAALAGARAAGWVLLRLPGATASVFEARLRDTQPLAADRVLHQIRATRGGALYDPRFGARGRGEGAHAELIAQLFATTAARLRLATRGDDDDDRAPTTFCRPASQLALPLA